jgi:hypothetical protein
VESHNGSHEFQSERLPLLHKQIILRGKVFVQTDDPAIMQVQARLTARSFITEKLLILGQVQHEGVIYLSSDFYVLAQIEDFLSIRWRRRHIIIDSNLRFMHRPLFGR